MSERIGAEATPEDLELLRLVKEEQALPEDRRADVLRLRARGWIEACYLEPTGYELTHVGQRVLAKERG